MILVADASALIALATCWLLGPWITGRGRE